MLIKVSHFTTPENFARPASTVTMPALTSTWAAFTVTLAAASSVTPEASKVALLPLLSSIVIVPGPSLRVRRCPPGVSTLKRSWPYCHQG